MVWRVKYISKLKHQANNKLDTCWELHWLSQLMYDIILSYECNNILIMSLIFNNKSLMGGSKQYRT